MQARSTLVPRLARLAPRCCSRLSPLAALGGGVKTWHGVKTRSLEELKWHFGRKLRDLSSPDDPMWRGCTTSFDPVNAQRRVTFSRRKDSGPAGGSGEGCAPDDPAPPEVLVRSVSPSWHRRLYASDDPTVQRAFIRCSPDKFVRRMCSSD